jgi:hypothetical protein
MMGLRKKKSGIAIGTRYCLRAAPHVVWEVLVTGMRIDGRPYVVLFNLADPTWQKTLSLAELERGHQYIRIDQE